MPAVVTGALELPFTFKPGSAIKASQVNANFEALRAKIDASSGAGIAPAVGTFTLAGILTDAPIRKFSQSITVPVSVGGQGTAKPQLSSVVIERDLGEGTPQVNHNVAQQKSLASASVLLGNLSIELTQVMVASVAVTSTRAGHPQEAIALTYGTIAYTWREPNEPSRTVTFDIAKGTGVAGTALALTYGSFPLGVTPDAAYVPVTSFDHQIVVPSLGARPQFGLLSLMKDAGPDTLDTLALALSSKPGARSTSTCLRTQPASATAWSSAAPSSAASR